MTALTKARDTKARAGRNIGLGVKSLAVIYAGSLVALDGAYAAPGRTALGLKGLGRAKATVDNSSGSDGDVTVEIERGVFLFANEATDLITNADIGSDAYIVDDETVARTSGTNTRSVAGKVHEVTPSGVYIEF
ncbi:hypothetical protein [Paremcibacter congregatus]|uniref:hypothetical protein n=1 Tax=Paremcibacter congregatus TaxID=2043170 RepID=UPI0030EDB9D9|tara:strand:+ start:6461 stop:6862 length:402 start_codon:yes stop_codon:yes gene_type:complete